MSRQSNIRSGTRLTLQTPSQNSLPPTTPIQSSYQSRFIKQILKLQSQKYNYQCQLQQLQQVQNKLIVNDKVNTKLKRSKTQLNIKLSTINREIQSKNKFISIKKKEMVVQRKKQEAIKGYDQLGSFKFEIEEKRDQLQELKKTIKSLETTNKGVEKKLLQYSLRGKQKLSQIHLLKMNQLMHQNQRLKIKIQKYNSEQLKKQDYLKKKPSSIQFKRKRSLLPQIKGKKQIMGKRHSVGEFSKLQSEKDLYTKFLSARKPRSQQKLSKQIQQAQNKQQQIQNKLFLSEQQITKIRSRLNQLKHLATPSKIQKARNTLMKSNQLEPKTSSIMVECNLNSKIQRRDWIGRFSGLRFSDSRAIREETRLSKIIYNNIGYYQFCYYPVSNPHQVFNSILPFDKKELSVSGKQTSFEVQYPDYIKSLKVKFNRTNNTIAELSITSNLGLSAQFPTKIGLTTNKISLDKKKSKTLQHYSLNYVPPQQFMPYTFDIKTNQAPTLMFGSYVVHYDQKRRIAKLFLQGLGVQTIEDYVEEIF